MVSTMEVDSVELCRTELGKELLNEYGLNAQYISDTSVKQYQKKLFLLPLHQKKLKCFLFGEYLSSKQALSPHLLICPKKQQNKPSKFINESDINAPDLVKKQLIVNILDEECNFSVLFEQYQVGGLSSLDQHKLQECSPLKEELSSMNNINLNLQCRNEEEIGAHEYLLRTDICWEQLRAEVLCEESRESVFNILAKWYQLKHSCPISKKHVQWFSRSDRTLLTYDTFRNEDFQECDKSSINVGTLGRNTQEHLTSLVNLDTLENKDSQECATGFFDLQIDKTEAQSESVVGSTKYFVSMEKCEDGVLSTHSSKCQKLHCFQCNECFLTKDNLKLHIMFCIVNESRECIKCKTSFTSVYLLQKHLVKHVNEVISKCHICNNTFKTDIQLRKHIEGGFCDGEKPFVCHTCKARFKMESVLIKHVEMHEKERYQCHFCQGKYRSKSILRDHILSHFNERTFVCKICGASFKTSACLRAHLSRHRAVEKKKLDGASKNPNDIPRKKRDLVSTITVKFKCHVCEKILSTKMCLNEHLRTHTGEKPYLCPKCGKTFAQMSNLHAHERSHSDIRPWDCPDCTKIFKTNAQLTLHRRVHTGERPYKCSVCNLRFTRYGTLHKHLTLHSGEPQFKCPRCGKGFFQKQCLSFHLKSNTCLRRSRPTYKLLHSIRTYQKDSLCELNGLQEKLYQCDVCGKSFSQKEYVLLHARIHTDAKPFRCPYCNVCFRRQSTFSRHITVIHQNKKKFICAYCSKTFGQKVQLVVHVKTHMK